MFVSVSRNGNLYFARFIAGKTGIFYSKNLNGVYQKATPLNLETDTARIINPAISPGETMLVFASGQMGGVGDADLFICYRQTDGSWSKPEGLPAPINSARADFAPSFSPYGKTLYWTSERPGIVPNFAKDKRPPGDIYHISVSTFKHN